MSYKYLTRDLFNPVEFIAAFRAVFDLLKGSYRDLLLMFIKIHLTSCIQKDQEN